MSNNSDKLIIITVIIIKIIVSVLYHEDGKDVFGGYMVV